MRIAMWSGPRNLSTAMMYAFGNRPDCAIWDEPFYAAYLAATGLDHPMRDGIIAGGETDPERVAARCTGSVPAGKRHFYQKHMAHHMIDGFPRGWMSELSNVFLVRHPARVVASYVRKRERPTLDDLGYRRLMDLHDHAVTLGQSPTVIDSADIRTDPRAALTRLCDRLGLPFEAAMLWWPSGGHRDDGPWAPHWYGAVHRSTGFDGPEDPLPDLDGDYADLVHKAMPWYEELAART